MLEKLAKSTARFFVAQNAIKAEYEEIYAYGAEILLSTVLNGIIALIIASITNTIMPSLIFLASFILLRRTAGGYHAKTHVRCMTILICIQIVFVLIINNIPQTVIPLYSYISIIFSGISIYIFSPVEHPNKKLKNTEKSLLRKKSLFYTALLSFLNILFLVSGTDKFSLYISSGLYTAVIAMLAEKIIPSGR